MLKRSSILQAQDLKFLTSLIAFFVSVALVFGGIPASAWASEEDAVDFATNETELIEDEVVADEGDGAAFGADAGQEVSTDSSELIEAVEDGLSEDLGNGSSHELGADESKNLSLFYIDEKVVAVGEEENIVVSFTDLVDADSFTLNYVKNGDASGLSVEASQVSSADGETSVLFTLFFSDASAIGDYRILDITWTGASGGTYEMPVSDDGISFSVVEEACDEGISVMTLDGDGTVVATEDVEVALDAVDADEAIDDDGVADIMTFAESRAVADAGGKLVIGLDPGHGGSDDGASSNGVLEKDLNLRIALACRDRLLEQGAQVVMTRTDDRYLGVNERPQIARNAGATVFVSFHINSATSVATGYEVWVQNANYRGDLSQESHALGDAVRGKLAQFGLSDRGNKESSITNDHGYDYPDGSAGDYLGVLRTSKNLGMPAILIEHGFINNSYDRGIMNSRAEAMGRADADALIAYYNIGGRWIEDGAGRKYQLSDGSYARSTWLTIDGSRYYFNESGYTMKYRTLIGGSYYYFRSYGAMVVGKWIDGRYYGADGVEAKPGFTTIDGVYCYIRDDGTMAHGLTTIDGKQYYFWYSNGGMVKNRWIGDACFGSDGARVLGGWATKDGAKCYIHSDGSLAKYRTLIGGSYYYFRSYGAMVVGKWIDGCYYGADGKGVSGGFTTIDGVYCYIRDDGTMAHGLTTIDGKQYYFWYSNGGMVKNRWIGDACFGSDGARVLGGWATKDGAKCYIHSDGSLAKYRTLIGGSYYYFRSYGAMVVGKWIDGCYYGADGKGVSGGFTTIDGVYCYIHSDGSLAKYRTLIGGSYYYFRSYGAMVVGKWIDGRYYGADGVEAKPGFTTIDGVYCYIRDDGTMAHGLTTIDGKQYYFWYSNGGMVKNRWIGDACFGSDGARVLGGWATKDGAKCYIHSDGSLAKYRTLIGGSYYYFRSYGAMVVSKWIDERYYQSNGVMASNQWIGDVWVDENGVIDPDASDAIMGQSKVTATQMANAYIKAVGSSSYPYQGNPDASTIYAFCNILVQEAQAEGVRADVAFAQSMLETDWLRFTGRCTADQYNFAGMGAIDSDPNNKGAYFKDIRTGLRAQIQHLKAYASTASLNNACVDPRFHLVTRGSAPVIQWLGIQENPNGYGWASGAGYGNKITRIMMQVEGK